MQRSAVSIPSNIAEGYKRNSIKEFIHFLGISNGSGAELETQLLIVQKLYPELPTNQSITLLTEIQKMLNSIINKNKTFLTPNS
jgi:four helix bundle protein